MQTRLRLILMSQITPITQMSQIIPPEWYLHLTPLPALKLNHFQLQLADLVKFTHSFQSLDPVNKSDLEDDLKRLNVCISVDTKDVRRRMVH